MTQLAEIFGPGGRLAACLSHFESRDGQQAMAEAVASLLESPTTEKATEQNSRILLIEAETGIGKTCAYLIPAALSGKRVVISTATLNLQDQIVNKDLPLVERVLDAAIPALCIKGRENYLCQYRWYQYRSNPQLSLVDDPWVEQIDSWLKNTTTGDRAELEWLSRKGGLWARISSQSSHCLGGDCPEAAGCFITQLRKRAGAARLLIVNHHLFFSDLALKSSGFGEILPRYEAVIFDEAHHLETVASAFFGKSFSQYQLLDLLGDIERQAKADLPPELIDSLLPTLHGLKMRLDAFGRLFQIPTGRFFLQSLIAEVGEKIWREQVEFLSEGISELEIKLKDCVAVEETWSAFRKRVGEQNDKLRDIGLFFDNNDHKFVHWYEKRERTVILSATPIEVALELQKNLYSTVESCILTSATLSSGGSFSYIRERLGLDENIEAMQFRSPFDYQQQTLLYVPEDHFPLPTDHNFAAAVGDRVLQILRLSKGRALILCTSFKGMDALAAYLETKTDYPLLVQGSASRNGLLDSFRKETHSVLLAVASFWEGVDVVGESLSCVIIDKLPFEVPSDPVIQARIERIKDLGGKPFFDFQVPRAILALRQGVGRLMRSATDRGVIAIMDVRLFKKGYGRIFRRSLPPSPITRDMLDIANFYTEPADAEHSGGNQ